MHRQKLDLFEDDLLPARGPDATGGGGQVKPASGSHRGNFLGAMVHALRLR